MDVLLVDFRSDGHHLEYASDFSQSLMREVQVETVSFLSGQPDDRDTEFFDRDAIEYIYPNGVADEITDLRGDLVSQTRQHVENGEYDIVHFLHLDDIVSELYHELSRWCTTTRIAGTVNGAFFRERSLINDLRTIAVKKLSSLTSTRIRTDRNELIRLINRSDIDCLFLHSALAKQYIDDETSRGTSTIVEVVPDPIELWEDSEQAAAREYLGLPSNEVITLFFGQWRDEKGIDHLISALESYDGPSFTMIVAGSPIDVSRQDFETATKNSSVDLRIEDDFIPQGDVKYYFIAADGVVLPYRRAFGDKRTSGVFQKAMGANRPVVVPDFGVFQKRVSEHELGITFTEGSSDALNTALTLFVERSSEIQEQTNIEEFALSQTYSALTNRSVDAYLNCKSNAVNTEKNG